MYRHDTLHNSVIKHTHTYTHTHTHTPLSKRTTVHTPSMYISTPPTYAHTRKSTHSHTHSYSSPSHTHALSPATTLFAVRLMKARYRESVLWAGLDLRAGVSLLDNPPEGNVLNLYKTNVLTSSNKITFDSVIEITFSLLFTQFRLKGTRNPFTVMNVCVHKRVCVCECVCICK